MSAAPKFTPGPWAVWEGNALVYACVTEQSRGAIKGVRVADCECLLDAREAEAHANARLIAAAPDLYEALRQCEDLLSELADGGAENPELGIARAALAKVQQP